MELTRKHTGIRVAPSRKAFLIFNTVFLLLICFVMLYPVIYVVAASFSEETAILRGDVTFIPVGAHVKAYQKVFVYPLLWQSYSNTLLYTVLGTAINLTLTVFGGWALSQRKMVGRRFFTLMCVFTMFFNGGMIPTFLVVKGLGMLNTIWAIVLPGAVSTYNMILMRTASLMTIGMFYAVAHWNAYFSAVLYLSKPELYPLQIILRQVVLLNEIVENSTSTENVMAEGIKYATIVVAMLPMLCIYPFVQRYFVKGVMIGSVKE